MKQKSLLLKSSAYYQTMSIQKHEPWKNHMEAHKTERPKQPEMCHIAELRGLIILTALANIYPYF